MPSCWLTAGRLWGSISGGSWKAPCPAAEPSGELHPPLFMAEYLPQQTAPFCPGSAFSPPPPGPCSGLPRSRVGKTLPVAPTPGRETPSPTPCLAGTPPARREQGQRRPHSPPGKRKGQGDAAAGWGKPTSGADTTSPGSILPRPRAGSLGGGLRLGPGTGLWLPGRGPRGALEASALERAGRAGHGPKRRARSAGGRGAPRRPARGGGSDGAGRDPGADSPPPPAPSPPQAGTKRKSPRIFL